MTTENQKSDVRLPERLKIDPTYEGLIISDDASESIIAQAHQWMPQDGIATELVRRWNAFEAMEKALEMVWREADAAPVGEVSQATMQHLARVIALAARKEGE